MRGTAQRGLTRVLFVVVIVAVAWVAVPFKDGDHTCYPAVWSALRDDRLYFQETSAVQERGGGLTVTVFCESQARRRVATSGVVIGLAAIGYIGGRRAFRRAAFDRSAIAS